MCSLSEPLESDVNRLCELFNVDRINLNFSIGKDITPLSLLCSSLEESEGHSRSLETLLEIMFERQIEPKGLLDNSSDDGFNILHRLCKNNYLGENLQKIIRLIDRKALWSKDSDGHNYPLHLLCKHYECDQHEENLIDII